MVPVAVLLAGCTAMPATTPSPPPPQFASYVDVTDAHPALAEAAHASGQQRYVLSFLLADNSRCAATWGGVVPLDDSRLQAQLDALHQDGGQVRVASGGATGTYLETACPSASALAAAYGAALDATGADQFEVDIEQPVPADRVADALTELHRQRNVDLTATVGVVDAQHGIDPMTMPLLKALAARGTAFTLNAMLMNFPYRGAWRDALIEAAETVAGQLQQLQPTLDRQAAYRRLGLTVMAGRNDLGATTTLDDARAVGSYAIAHRIRGLGLWSLGRDNGSCPGKPAASGLCSGVEQRPYGFTVALTDPHS